MTVLIGEPNSTQIRDAEPNSAQLNRGLSSNERAGEAGDNYGNAWQRDNQKSSKNFPILKPITAQIFDIPDEL